MNSIKRSKCDDCGCDNLGVDIQGPCADGEWVPVFFVCQFCEPKIFENVARQDIDSWLTGNILS